MGLRSWMSMRFSIQILLSLILLAIILILNKVSDVREVILWFQGNRNKEIIQFHAEVNANRDAELVVLPETYVASQKAFCLDGSPPGYFIRNSLSINKWILHLPVGAWCKNAENCARRSKSRLGSTRYENKFRSLQGLMSGDCRLNPDFCNWNVVEFIYCDGSSFAGNVSEPLVYNGMTLYMRGAVIFDVMVKYLLEHTHFSKAEHILVTGSSAGSLAALLQVDHLREMLPPSVGPVSINAVIDGGLFLDLPDINGNHIMKQMLKDTFEFHNIKDAWVVRRCTSEIEDHAAWNCFMPEVFNQYVATPTYYFNSFYDSWYGPTVLNVNCWNSIQKCKVQEEKTTQLFTEAVTKLSQNFLRKENRGMFLTSCFCHAVLNKNIYFHVKSNGFTAARALKLWMDNDLQSRNLLELKSHSLSGEMCT